MKNKQIIMAASILIFCTQGFGQYTTDKVVGEKNAAELDSLKKVNYPYLLPAWGQRVVQKGFSLPYSAGVSVQYVWQQSDIIINNLQVGFNNGPKHNLDEIIRFDNAQTNTKGINVRPDFWVFPFLNVYGIWAQSQSSTAVDCGLWIPDSSGWKKVTDFNTKAEFNATTIGFGVTPTFGIGGFFFAFDMNFTWTSIQELDKPAYVYILGPRVGKNFKFENERSLAIWAGGFRVQMSNGTTGNLDMSDLFPTGEWQKKVDTGFLKVANAQNSVNIWWDGLTTAEQKNPANIAKHTAANAALTKAGNFLNAASQGLTTIDNSTVQYSLDKRPKDEWNFIIGSQFQINRRWMIRAEYGFLGSRQQFIGGLQYRFGL